MPIVVSHFCTDISRDSVATQLRFGGIFNYHFFANCPESVPIKNIFQLVNIWQKYGKSQSGTFLEKQCIAVIIINVIIVNEHEVVGVCICTACITGCTMLCICMRMTFHLRPVILAVPFSQRPDSSPLGNMGKIMLLIHFSVF